MKYNNIKNILRKQIDNGVKTFWTYNEKEQEFVCIYKNYNDGLTIYTPQQLLNKIMNKDA
tara:strand:+ start:3066 stop:3245 length:180 start_codon:yes stop_codon:yes gene_type:complete